MNLSFYLHNSQDKKGRRLIYARYTHKGGKYRFSTGLKIEPKNWNARKEAPRQNFFAYSNFVHRLEAITLEVLEIAAAVQADGLEPTAKRIERRHKQGEGAGVEQHWQAFMSEYVRGLAENTQAKYRRAWDLVVAYEAKGGRGWPEMGQDFAEGFVGFLTQQQRMKPQSARIYLAKIRAFSNWMERRGLGRAQSWRVSITDQAGRKVFLSREELRTIETLPLEGEDATARDMFVFLAHTGMRYSEAQAVKATDAQGGILYFLSRKTKRDGEIPLSSKAQEILHLHQGAPHISLSRLNVLIKNVARQAGIEQQIKDGETYRPKCEMITSHTARRTFASLMLEAGVDLSAVAKMLGHADIKITAKHYDRRTNHDQQAQINALFGDR